MMYYVRKQQNWKERLKILEVLQDSWLLNIEQALHCKQSNAKPWTRSRARKEIEKKKVGASENAALLASIHFVGTSYSALLLIRKHLNLLLCFCLDVLLTFGFIIQNCIYALDCFDIVREMSIILNQHLKSSVV